MHNLDYLSVVYDDSSPGENGFLSLLANITRTGVFTYFQKSPDGTIKIIRQLRHPDDVFSEESMSTLMGLPTTNEHPSELVSKENAKNLLIGMTSDRPKKIQLDDDEESYIQQKVTFFDSESIEMIVSGERQEMSLGYTCRLDEESGEWNGQKYDYIQRDIRYNHLSLVDKARGGSECRVILNDGCAASKESIVNVNCDGLSLIDELENDKMKIFVKDGVEHKVSEEIYTILSDSDNALAKVNAELSEAKSSADKLEAKYDALKVELDSKEEKLSDDEFAAAVKAKVELVSKAEAILDSEDDLIALSDREIKEKVIKFVNKDANLEGKSDDYIDACFDIFSEAKKSKSEEIIGKSKVNKDSTDSVKSYAEARAAAFERDQKRWMKK